MTARIHHRVAGTTLTPAERSFLRERAVGLIVSSNVEAPAQVCLTASFREAVGCDAPVLVDQEGGRVQRLGPPHWPAYPPGAAYGRIYDRDAAEGTKAAYLGARLIAADLVAVGIDVDCLPIADVPVAGAHSVIGNRAYGETADKVAKLARAVAEGLLMEGVLPVLKHIPGHGRATADSHGELPIVEADRATLMATDFAAFRPLFDLPLGMTAHIVYTAIDPIAPATTSVTLVRDVIRDWLKFRGLLMRIFPWGRFRARSKHAPARPLRPVATSSSTATAARRDAGIAAACYARRRPTRCRARPRPGRGQ